MYRPAYQGSNPISDVWALRAVELCAKYLIKAVEHPYDDDARSNMLLASSMAGMGFGNAGVHYCHGMSYPVSGMVKTYKPAGLNIDHPIVPHGMSVVLNAPAVFRFTGPACPERHLDLAGLMGTDVSKVKDPVAEAGELLASLIVDIMKRLKIPNGLAAIGYSEADIPRLVEGTLPQHRVTKLSPRIAEATDLELMFKDALHAWN